MKTSFNDLIVVVHFETFDEVDGMQKNKHFTIVILKEKKRERKI